MPLSSTFSTAAGATELRGWKVASSSKDGTACALSCCGAGHWQPRTCVGYGALAPRLLAVLIMIYSSGKHCLPARSIHVYKKKIPPFYRDQVQAIETTPGLGCPRRPFFRVTVKVWTQYIIIIIIPPWHCESEMFRSGWWWCWWWRRRRRERELCVCVCVRESFIRNYQLYPLRGAWGGARARTPQ